MNEDWCTCENVDFGSYGNQVELTPPQDINIMSWDGQRKNTVCVDACLAKEIQYLWSKGVMTSGCCCGHKKEAPYIGVFPESESKMLDLGYEFYEWSTPGRTDTYKPKTAESIGAPS